MGRIDFKLAGVSGQARAGVLRTRRGEVPTPVFMPVGTHAAVRGTRAEEVWGSGARIMLANTYHLRLRPGPEVFERLGGIHRFMAWDGAVLTDSGGFQIFSLPGSRELTEDGAVFRSYVDGRLLSLSPEESVRTQLSIGSDIMMVLDECVPSTSGRDVAARAVERTNRWAVRSLTARGDAPGALFAIVQGALFPDLRRESAGFLTGLPFDGFAIGGLAVGESRAEREEFTALTAPFLPADRPRYLMGVGTPLDLLEAVHRGVDMFDCILPTAMAQHGRAYTFDGLVHLRRSVYRYTEAPIDPSCPCPACRRYSRAYIHHLIKAGDGLGWRLIAQHNLWFYQALTTRMRASILDGTWAALHADLRQRLDLNDQEDGRRIPPPVAKARVSESLGAFTVKTGTDGLARIAHIGSGESMHPAAPPDDEAHGLYVKGPRLPELVAEGGDGGELVIWDVGLGAAHNAMAVIRSLESPSALVAGGSRVRLVSFERDLDALRLARMHIRRFGHLKHPAPAALLDQGAWQSKCGKISWRLEAGDALERMGDADGGARAPRLVFWDPFSFKTDVEMWMPAAFARLRSRIGDAPGEVWTYSTSTAVRSALLASGFHVAATAGVGGRHEATVAYTPSALTARMARGEPPYAPLAGAWLDRWRRSAARVPVGLDPEAERDFVRRIEEHPQFDPSFDQASDPEPSRG